MTNEFEYSMGLALFDFIPVLLSSAGLLYLARAIGLIHPSIRTQVLASALLIITGGFCKVFWKFLIAATEVHYPVLNNCFFIFLAPGFTLLTYYLWSARKAYQQRPAPGYTFAWPLLIIVLFASIAGYLAVAFPEQRKWFLALLVLVTVSNVVLIWHAVRHCLQLNLRASAVLFVVNLVGVFVLAGLARLGHQDEAVQWVEQILNAFTQGALLAAALMLYKKHRQIQSQDHSLSTNL
ncbi:hypothetical protein [Rheinheimera sp. 1928-s]|uniref:hypothetical protein n=1 Tax=Rheinheimera sp. 1928-s TaxID=3033803 RepID=UPI00262F7FA3|nr:hypothetical protein [Rheinheimera sp. 1928-s]MDF3125324.1 hypothetical protein [Rheinheimera sp. 1928-s]